MRVTHYTIDAKNTAPSALDILYRTACGLVYDSRRAAFSEIHSMGYINEVTCLRCKTTKVFKQDIHILEIGYDGNIISWIENYWHKKYT